MKSSCSISLFDRVIQTYGDSAFSHHALALGRQAAFVSACGIVNN
jgi:hypothetical protein